MSANLKVIKNIYINICILGEKGSLRGQVRTLLLSDNTLLNENINVSHRINPLIH